MIEERPFGDVARMATTLATDIARHLRDAVAARGIASFVATGGTTPAPLYRALAQCDVPWSRVVITLSDERWVAPDHPASNEGMVRRMLLVGAASAVRFVPLKTDAPTPAEAELDAERAIESMPFPFDVCLLGIGTDGHVASLFPGLPMRDDGYVQSASVPTAAGAVDRLSLTMGALAGSRWICLMFTGAEKLAVFRAAQTGLSSSPLGELLARTKSQVAAYWSPEDAP